MAYHSEKISLEIKATGAKDSAGNALYNLYGSDDYPVYCTDMTYETAVEKLNADRAQAEENYNCESNLN